MDALTPNPWPLGVDVEDRKKLAIILRGLPGSGKSTFAREIADDRDDCVVFNADSYHMVDGEYRYSTEKAGWAHSQCLKAFTIQAIAGLGTLIVDNTNTSSLQMAPYVRVAEAFGYEIWILEMECSILDSIRRNIHGVPEKTIRKMAMGLARGLPGDWEAKYTCYNVSPDEARNKTFALTLV